MRRCCNQTVERDQDIFLKQETSRMSLATASTCRFPTHKGWPLWLRRSESNGKSYLSELIFFPNLGFCFWILLFFLFRHLKSFGKLWGRENDLLNKPYLLTFFQAPADDIRWHTNSKTDDLLIVCIYKNIYMHVYSKCVYIHIFIWIWFTWPYVNTTFIFHILASHLLHICVYIYNILYVYKYILYVYISTCTHCITLGLYSWTNPAPNVMVLHR